VAVSFIDGGNRSTLRKAPTCRKSLTNLITKRYIEYTSPWTGFDLTILVVIRTDCTGSCKSNYYTITAFWPWWVCDVLLTELVCFYWMFCCARLYSYIHLVGKLVIGCSIDHGGYLMFWQARTKEPINNHRWFILSHWNLDWMWRSSNIPSSSLFGI
jgi:hypothetical protein